MTSPDRAVCAENECVGFADRAIGLELREHEFAYRTTKRQSSSSVVTHLATPNGGRAGGR